MQPLRGSFWALVLYDVAEQIQLDKLRGLIRAEPPRREPSFKHPATEYVRFDRPPVVESPAPPQSCSPRGASRSRGSFAANCCHCPKPSVTKCCSPACPTILVTCWLSAGSLPLCTIRPRAPHPRSSCSNTPTHSCLSFVIM